jgi:hypothetical protein
MTTNDLSLRRVQSLEPQSLDEARALANAAVASRLYQVATPESALMILLTGRDLGLTASQSFRAVYVVSGKPVVSSDAMVAAIRRSGLCKSWRVIETTAERCTIETTRIEESEPERETFTLEDAKRAKLDAKDVWRAYPRDMLRHRCAAALARRVYPDVILGCYVPGEIDDPPVEPMRVEVTPSKPSRSKLSDEEKASRVSAIIGEYRAALAREENADAAYDAAKRRGRDDGVATLVQDALQREMSEAAERKRAEYDEQQAAYSRLVSELDSAETSAAVIAVWTDNAAAIKLLPEQHRRQAWSETVARWSAVGGEDKGQGLRDALNERGES